MRKIITISLLMFFVVAAGDLFAGWSRDLPVTVTKYSDGSGSAYGAYEATRFSSDSKSCIYCTVISDGYVYCGAIDANGVRIDGKSNDPNIRELAKTVTALSNLTFNVDANGNLTYLKVSNHSIDIR